MQKQVSTKQADTMITDLTQGNVVKLLLVFSAPLFVSNALQAIYNIVDMIVIGRVVGGAGMAAVSTGGNILHILTFLAMGFSSAGQIIIARDVGTENMDGVKKAIGTMFTLLLSMAIIMSVICFFIRTQILDLVNTPPEAYAYTMDYTVICIAGLVFIYGYNIVSAILRGMGDSKRPFYFVAIAAIMNTILDIVFVAFFHMEAMGAALATVIGQGFSFLFSVLYLYKNRESFGFDFKPISFLPDGKTIGRLFALGIPMALQSAAISVSMTVVAAWVNSFGYISSAIAGILGKLNMMMGIMSQSVTTAAGSMVGQNLGARKYKRVPQILFWTFTISLIMAVISSVVLWMFPDPIFRMFTKDEKVLVEASVIILPCVLNFLGAATRSFAFGIINGSGNAKLNLAVAILDGVLSRIGLAYLLGFAMAMGPLGFWMGDALAGFVPCIIGGVFYLSGRWKA